MSRHELDERKDADILQALAGMGQPRAGERTDADLVGSAMAAMLDPRCAPPEPPPLPVPVAVDAPSRAPVIIAAATAALAVAAAVAAALLSPVGLLGESAADPTGSLAPDVFDRDAEQFEAVPGQAKELGKQGKRPPAPAAVDADKADPDLPPNCEDAAPGQRVCSDGDTTVAARPTRRKESPNDLLTRAQRLFGTGRTPQAVKLYEALVARHGSTAAGKAARVSLGRIELSRGRAKQALAHFDAYLAASAGPLVEEARYGRIRALRKLGRTAQELRSVEAFLADYGKSIYAARLTRRAVELGAQ